MHSHSDRRHARRHEGGQTIVIFAIGLFAMVSMVGLVIDGGNAYAQQRAVQNGSDAAAEAGATALARSVMGAASGTTTSSSQLDANVLAAVNASALANRIQPFDPGAALNSAAYYTDVNGGLLTSSGGSTGSTSNAAQVGAGDVPACATGCVGGRAAGVAAFGRRDFRTFIAGAIGLSSFTASAQATAIEGYEPPTNCTASQGCAILPITFATNTGTCNNTDTAQFGSTPWGFPTKPPFTSSNETILAICKDGSGAFGFLDFGCAPNLQQQISSPCNNSITFPTWLQTQPGNTNSVESALNAYAGSIVGTYETAGPVDQTVQIPFFDAICHAKSKPADTTLIDTTTYPYKCVGDLPSGGNNTYFHVVYFLGFALDHAYVQGNNNPACNAAPGSPIPGGNGATACLKGWGASVTEPPGPVTSNPGPGGPGSPLRVQLIK